MKIFRDFFLIHRPVCVCGCALSPWNVVRSTSDVPGWIARSAGTRNPGTILTCRKRVVLNPLRKYCSFALSWNTRTGKIIQPEELAYIPGTLWFLMGPGGTEEVGDGGILLIIFGKLHAYANTRSRTLWMVAISKSVHRQQPAETTRTRK